MQSLKPSPFVVAAVAVGAALLGVGLWQNAQPKPVAADNRGFETDAPRPPGQIADTPPEISALVDDAAGAAVKAAEEADRSIQATFENQPWLSKAVAAGAARLRPQILADLQAEERSGNARCSPSLLPDLPAANAEVTLECIDIDGDKLTVELQDDGGLDLGVKSQGEERVTLRLDGGEISIEIR